FKLTFPLQHFFFFQAEDGIRDFHVTGVQTCALPIWDHVGPSDRPDGPTCVSSCAITRKYCCVPLDPSQSKRDTVAHSPYRYNHCKFCVTRRVCCTERRRGRKPDVERGRFDSARR